MKHHLMMKHAIQCIHPPAQKRKGGDLDDEDEDVKPQLKRMSSAPPRLDAFLANAPKSKEQTTALIVNMIIDDLLPVNTVTHSGLKNLLKYLAPNYTVPCRASITARLEAKHDELTQKAITLLSSPTVLGVGLTTDMWTSLATEGFIGLTCHYIDRAWQMRSLILASEEMAENHTGVNIAARLTELAKTFGIREKVGAVVHDNAASCNLAAKLLHDEQGWEHQPCVGHTLQLAVEEGLSHHTISTMIRIAKKIVGHFNHSALACTKLHKVQEQQGKKKLNLIQDVATRWNSTYLMLQRLVDQQTAVTTVLENERSSLKMSGAQWDLAKDVVHVLKPLQVATTVLSMEGNPSTSCVQPILHGLLNDHLKTTDADSTTIKQLKSAIAGDLRDRFPQQKCKLAWLASALDPRFKSLDFLSAGQRATVWEDARAEVKKLHDGKPAPAAPGVTPAATEDEGEEEKSGIAFLLGSTRSAPADQETDEVSRYMAEPSSASVDKGSPLKWWKANESRFPLLAKVAKKVLAIPATSTPTERLFSTAGLICTKKRARLSAEHVDMLVFLHENRAFLEAL